MGKLEWVAVGLALLILVFAFGERAINEAEELSCRVIPGFGWCDGTEDSGDEPEFDMSTSEGRQAAFEATMEAQRDEHEATREAQREEATMTAEARSFEATMTAEAEAFEAEMNGGNVPTPTPGTSGNTGVTGGSTGGSTAGCIHGPMNALNEGCTIPAGGSAILRIITRWPTATEAGEVRVCYTHSLGSAITVGPQANGSYVDAWARPDFVSWQSMQGEANTEAERIRGGSLGGTWDVPSVGQC